MSSPNSMARWCFGATALIMLTALPATAQRRFGAWERDCNRDGDRDSERFCRTSESTMPSPGGALVIDGKTNGGVSVFGSSRRDVLIRARIQANARIEERAEQIAGEIRIRTDGGRIWAEGPETSRREWWSVSYEVEVPSRSDLDLRAMNGGLSIVDVSGVLRLETTNGGIHLEAVSGDVVAETTNGGMKVLLDGDRWQGKGLDAVTTNGGVSVHIPDGYSAHLETGTVNGAIDIDFPVTVQGRIGRRITTDLGRGGATIRVITTNGGVVIRRG
jgi:putative adhesin